MGCVIAPVLRWQISKTLLEADMPTPDWMNAHLLQSYTNLL